MATITGTVVAHGQGYRFNNDDGTPGQRLSTGGEGGDRPYQNPENEIELSPFRDWQIEVEGTWEHDWVIDVTSIKQI